MKNALAVAVTVLMVAPLAPTAALAHPAPFPHVHEPRPAPARPVVRRRVVRKRVVYRPAPRRVVVVRPAPAVVVHEPAPVVVARPAPEPPRDKTLSLGVRALGASVSGDKIGLAEGENPTMGGAGIVFRSRLGKQLGLELSADILGGEGANFSQRTIPVMAAVTYHLFPESRLQPYVLAGAGVHFTRMKYLDGLYRHDLTEVAGQFGGGLELFLGRDVSLHADLRGMPIVKNVDTRAEVRQDCLSQVGGMSGFCDGIHDADPEDKMNMGLTFQAGVNFRF